MKDLKTIIDKFQEDFETTLQSGSAESQERLLAIVAELDSVIKERIRTMCRDEMRKMINRLKNGLDITPDDIARIKVWVIGDEEGCARFERHCRVWEDELKDILEEIKILQKTGDSLADYARFQIILHRASTLLTDIVYCHQQKEALDQFYRMGSEVAPEHRAFLIKILEKKSIPNNV